MEISTPQKCRGSVQLQRIFNVPVRKLNETSLYVNENAGTRLPCFIEKIGVLKELKSTLIDKTCCYSDNYALLHHDSDQ